MSPQRRSHSGVAGTILVPYDHSMLEKKAPLISPCSHMEPVWLMWLDAVTSLCSQWQDSFNLKATLPLDVSLWQRHITLAIQSIVYPSYAPVNSCSLDPDGSDEEDINFSGIVCKEINNSGGNYPLKVFFFKQHRFTYCLPNMRQANV